jgi:AraC-like DNA-binding protein
VDRSIFAPGPEFAPFVHSFLHFTKYFPEHEKERVIPDGSAYLIFALDGRPRRVFDNETLRPAATLSGVWLSGVHRDYITIEALPDSSLAAIRFRAGGARPILGELFDHSLGRVAPGEELAAIDARSLLGRLSAAGSAEECWRCVGAWLRVRLKHARPVSGAVATAVRRIEADPLFAVRGLSALVAESGYSHKQFIHLFKRYVGLTPKAFQRIQRFHEILPRVIAQRELSWADVSHECGYYDQSHFAREFKRFSGHTPSGYLKIGTNRTNFLPVTER